MRKLVLGCVPSTIITEPNFDPRIYFAVAAIFSAVCCVRPVLAGTKDKIRKADMDMAQLKANAVASSGRGVGRPIPSQMRR